MLNRSTPAVLKASDTAIVSGRQPPGKSTVTRGRATVASDPWLVVVIVCVAQFMVVLDATIVNVARPSIQRGVRFSPSSLQWVINMYTLIFGGFILLGGRAGDLIGRKRVFGAGIVLFSGASLVNGLARSSSMLCSSPAGGCKDWGARCSRRRSSRSSQRPSATRRIARRRWRSGARSPPVAGPWGCCWAGC
jgi:Major Facilitator Superfamily